MRTTRGEPAPQHPAARRLEHRRLHRAVTQYQSRATGAGVITVGELARTIGIVHEYTVAA
jgi:hypothetical protein